MTPPEGHPGFASYRRLSPQFQQSLSAVTLGIYLGGLNGIQAPANGFENHFALSVSVYQDRIRKISIIYFWTVWKNLRTFWPMKTLVGRKIL
jgi:hypothetical protein